MTTTIYTIGHSTLPIEAFIALLQRHSIDVVSDVRSSPRSRHNPQFNIDELKPALRNSGIKYVFLGKELGARSDNPACYKDNQVQYDILSQTPEFRSGIERVRTGADRYRIALMCAEKDPLECHRTILVARELEREGFAISHILPSGEVETHEHAVNRLIDNLGLRKQELLADVTDVEADAYATQASRIAYRKPVRNASTSHRSETKR